jgi:beta-glucanase (GH16 family)
MVAAGVVLLVSVNGTADATAVPPKSAASAKPATVAPCGGEKPVRTGGGVWTCSFDDEFSGTTLDMTKWTPSVTVGTLFTTGPVGSEVCYYNNPNIISESGGYLYLTVRKEANPFRCGTFTTQYSGGSVTGTGKFSQTYGRFEVRAKFPSVTVAGLQETLWLYPVNALKYGPRPVSGEIDFAEAYSFRSTLNIPTIHYVPVKADPNVTAGNCLTSGSLISGSLTSFHTYALVWTTTSLTITVDGTTCLTDYFHPAAPLIAPQPFDQPFFVALTQALGINSNAFNPSTTPLPATTAIDYVRVWK